MPEGRANKAATPCTRVGSFKLLFLVRAIVGIVRGEEASQPKRPIATREACAWAKWLTVTTWQAFVLIVRYVKYKQRGST